MIARLVHDYILTLEKALEADAHMTPEDKKYLLGHMRVTRQFVKSSGAFYLPEAKEVAHE